MRPRATVSTTTVGALYRREGTSCHERLTHTRGSNTTVYCTIPPSLPNLSYLALFLAAAKNCGCVGIYNDAFFLPATQCRFEVGSQYLKSTSIAAPQAAGMIKRLRAHPGELLPGNGLVHLHKLLPSLNVLVHLQELSSWNELVTLRPAYCSSGSCYHSGCDNPLPSNFFSDSSMLKPLLSNRCLRAGVQNIFAAIYIMTLSGIHRFRAAAKLPTVQRELASSISALLGAW